jgi:transposase-like protein
MLPRSLARSVLGSILVRRRWSADEARQVLDMLDSSGLSAGQFAARTGVEAQRLHRWRRALGGGGGAGTPAFVEITPVAATSIEVVLRSGHVLRVPDGFGEDALRRLVAVLEGPGTKC